MSTELGLLNLNNKNWSVIYEKAIKEDGSLFFPERISHEFLQEAKKKMGTILFSNQYLNEVFPDGDAKFKKEWFKYYEYLPDCPLYHFAHIDPAISTEDGADFTGVAVVSVDSSRNWYIRRASRERLTPTQIVNLVFDLCKEYGLSGIGVESVAYQKALIHLIVEKMNDIDVLPLKEIKRGPTTSKEMRILSLAPRFEWGKVYHRREMTDLEKELLQFPRSAHDDVIDAVSSLEDIVFYPDKEEIQHEPVPGSPEWERKVINSYYERANERNNSED